MRNQRYLRAVQPKHLCQLDSLGLTPHHQDMLRKSFESQRLAVGPVTRLGQSCDLGGMGLRAGRDDQMRSREHPVADAYSVRLHYTRVAPYEVDARFLQRFGLESVIALGEKNLPYR